MNRRYIYIATTIVVIGIMFVALLALNTYVRPSDGGRNYDNIQMCIGLSVQWERLPFTESKAGHPPQSSCIGYIAG
jgi:hypothetical protein